MIEPQKGATNRNDVIIAVLHLIQGSLWPVLALMAAAVIYTPATKVLSTLPHIIEKAKEINMGAFSIRNDENRLPKPTPEISEKIRMMNETSIEFLLKRDIEHTYYECRKYANGNYDIAENHVVDQLISIDILRKLPPAEGYPSYCYNTKLSPIGVEVKRYLINLLSAQIKPS